MTHPASETPTEYKPASSTQAAAPKKYTYSERVVSEEEKLAMSNLLPPSKIFQQLYYGPAPESDDALKAWFDSQGRKFGNFINNEWHKPEGRRYRKSTCPADNSFLAETIESTEEDVEVAVQAAKAAYPAWNGMSGFERSKILYSVARHIQKHERILVLCECQDNGKSFREGHTADIPLLSRHWYHHAGWAALMDTEMSEFKSLGVIGEIVPWNFPLMLMTWKVCPALAMGNTVVLKPASYTRLSALLFAQICAEAGLPPGVLNIITGGGEIGSTLIDHPLIDKVAFTGSTPVGRLLRRRIAGSGKKISLELGGKSPVVVYDNCDIDSVVEGLIDAVFFNQGQVCSAGSRLIVAESIHDKLLEKLRRRLTNPAFRIGLPLEKNIDMGALVDKSQYDTIQGFCERAAAAGANVWMPEVVTPHKDGWYWPPTVISNVSPVHECVQEEIFGPVLSVMRFRTTEEAVELANNTKFGLGGSVWTENISIALETALRIKAGTVWINCHNMFDSAAGFGGYRESGYGRDGGKEGLYEYVRPKHESRPDINSLPLKYPLVAAPKWPTHIPCQPLSLPVHGKDVKTTQKQNIPNGHNDIDRTYKMYIDGAQARPDGQYSWAVTNAKGELIGSVGDGNRKDIREAVSAAAAAAGGWGKRAAHNRAQICYYIAENLSARHEEFAHRIFQQNGGFDPKVKIYTIEDARTEVDKSIETLFYYAAYADKFGGSVQETTLYGVTTKVHEPVGVLGIRCPDEYPLLGFVSLFAPAVVRANTIVILPSTTAPLSAVDLYQVFDTSDLPNGVVNIITGHTDSLCKTLCEHNEVQAFWYFGCAEVSACVEYYSSENMKRSWVNYGMKRDWLDSNQSRGLEFLLHATEVKNIWIPMGEARS